MKQKYGDKVDLCELEWEDRERVLRLLFAKMNAGVPPPLWRDNLPAIDNKPAFEAMQDSAPREEDEEMDRQQINDMKPRVFF